MLSGPDSRLSEDWSCQSSRVDRGANRRILVNDHPGILSGLRIDNGVRQRVLEAPRTVENPVEVIANGEGRPGRPPQAGSLPHMVFITIGGPQAHVDRRGRPPHMDGAILQTIKGDRTLTAVMQAEIHIAAVVRSRNVGADAPS
jgi:hypothetical protein